jgi:hypothetical protein
MKHLINVREYLKGNKKKWTIQRYWQHKQDEDKQSKTTTQLCVGHHYAQTR